MQRFLNFLKDITTLKTVWIDKGQGKWIVKKRMHPVLRGLFWVMAVSVGVGAYINFSSINEIHKENAQPDPVISARVREPEKLVTLPVTQPVQPEPEKQETLVIPLKAAPKPDPILKPAIKKGGDIFERPEKLLAPRKNNDDYRIVINKSKFLLTLYKGDEIVRQYSIATGRNPGDKQRVGDNRTPTGNFKIVSIEPSSTWKHDFGDGKGKISGAYGPWFLRLDAKGWKGIGIHGTHDPDSRGTRATEGCIRLSNEDISELRRFAYRNMPVTIREN